jgi:hypothetical protein
MVMQIIEGLPSFLDCPGETLNLCVRGMVAVVRCDRFIARVSLPSGKIDWLVERTPVQFAEATSRLPRYINLFGADAVPWVAENIIAEILRTECGGMRVSARDAVTGVPLWEQFVPVPNSAEWAEPTPAWPGAQTEEIYGFIANDPQRLVVCMTRHTRRSMHYSPTVTVDTLPPFGCQTDAIRFDPSSGMIIWRATFKDVHVGILERRSFAGMWARSPRLGIIDFETGTNTILQELPHSLGWPVPDGLEVAVSWHSQDQVGVEWLDGHGHRVRAGAWSKQRVSKTYLHRTDAGLAVQINDQGLSWLENESRPLWTVRAKPYIYRVHRAPESDVFIGTDGNGGRLLAFDADSGEETLNLKPALGGVGHLVKIADHAMLASTFCVSRSYSAVPRLLVLSMMDRQYTLDNECFLLLATWEHGVICRIGRDGDRIAVFDLRSAGRCAEKGTAP